MKRTLRYSLLATAIAITGLAVNVSTAFAADETINFQGEITNSCTLTSIDDGILTHNSSNQDLFTDGGDEATVDVDCAGPATFSLSNLDADGIGYTATYIEAKGMDDSNNTITVGNSGNNNGASVSTNTSVDDVFEFTMYFDGVNSTVEGIYDPSIVFTATPR